MDLEPIGLVTFIVGLLIFRRGPTFGIWALALSTLLGAAAAVKLPALGGASVPPAIVVALFFTLSVAARHPLRASARTSLVVPLPGFWLLAFTAYAVLSAYFLPRIFEDMSYVYSLARNGDEIGIVSLPLRARASNLTQACYLAVNLLCFAAVAGYAARGGTRNIANALLAAATALLFFAVVDVVAHYTHTPELLSFIRNANYRMLDSGEIGGFKRIVGSFTEAGAYSYAAIGLFAFTLGLWLDGVRTRLTGTLAACLALTLLLSTSTTAYASLAVYAGIVLVGCVARFVAGRASVQDATYLMAAALVPLLILAVVILLPTIWAAVTSLFDATITNKLATQSGVERMRWNEHAMRTFRDTFGFGAGTGSVRASSMLVSLLANVGVIGLLLFAALLGSVAVPARSTRLLEGSVWRAGSGACVALATAACISAGSIDLGLPFSIFAGLAAAGRMRQREAARHPDREFRLAPWPRPASQYPAPTTG